MSVEKPKIKSIVVDTFTAFQKNEVLAKWEKGQASHSDWKDYGVDIVMFIKKLIAEGFEVVGVIGAEGTGKSYIMKTMEPGTNIWFNADEKNPTWQGGRVEYGTVRDSTPFMQKPKTYDDVLKTIRLMKTADRFTEAPIAFLLAHTEEFKATNGQIRQRLKTLGSLANKMNIEDKFNICYYSEVKLEGNKVTYNLRTQNNGSDTCRTLEGLHTTMLVPNDGKMLIEAIENYK